MNNMGNLIYISARIVRNYIFRNFLVFVKGESFLSTRLAEFIQATC